MEFDPRNIEAYLNRAYAKLKLKNFQGALSDYSKALNYSPDNGFIYFKRAETQIMLGNVKGACDDLDYALQYKYNEAIHLIKKHCK